MLLPPKYIEKNRARRLSPGPKTHTGHRTFVAGSLWHPRGADRQRSSRPVGCIAQGYRRCWMWPSPMTHPVIRQRARAPPDLVSAPTTMTCWLPPSRHGTFYGDTRLRGVDLIVARGRRPHRRLATMVQVPESSMRCRQPVLAAGDRPWPPDHWRWPWGRKGVVRVGLVDTERSRNAPVVRTGFLAATSSRRAVPVANRQTSAHARTADRRMGSAWQPRPRLHAAAERAVSDPRCASRHRPAGPR